MVIVASAICMAGAPWLGDEAGRCPQLLKAQGISGLGWAQGWRESPALCGLFPLICRRTGFQELHLVKKSLPHAEHHSHPVYLS